MKKYILSIDSGTTGITAILVDRNLNIVQKEYLEIKQYYPKPGWVEHDPKELIEKITKIIHKITKNYSAKNIQSIGITNQRETIVVWNKKNKQPIYNAIVWQCRRTKEYCNTIKKYDRKIFKKTGLYIDSYFSATKIKWIFDNIQIPQKQFKNNQICIGTIDSWIIWNLTNGEKHVTDYTNASRTMLFNINDKKWDKELLDIFNIKENALPKVKNSMDNFGVTKINDTLIPIQGVAGDQQSALFGQGCVNEGTSKCTYGTGLFYLSNIGKHRQDSKNRLLTTLASDENGEPVYAIEGSVFIGGAVIQWLRDELKLIDNASDTERIALDIKGTDGVYIVPAFVGLGAPYWNSECKGIITGITRGTNKKHLIRAALESIAYQVNDLIECIKKDINKPLKQLNVDGGATNNSFLLQFQSDISNIKIAKPANIESTALGAAILAGLNSRFWRSIKEPFKNQKKHEIYTPQINKEKRMELINGWNKAIKDINQ
ncbi:MAG: glycerol kinase [Candidatus Marinimicrobia bacterium]|nr:glycerol kinase [Candidatus Neomarinimicrobiota bacterium]|tara:strand:+ start:8000 stop:9463 length:1464 start_codon:yes stop_codon:yes gene_type:complete